MQITSNMPKQYCRLLVPLALFVVAFIAVPLRQMHGLELMPGDIGDARLNNYFLENVYQFFFGRSESLWQLGFYYPFPYVLGFSDNLFGSAPIYMVTRYITGETDTAFQFWFLAGYLVNFLGAYYALRRLGGSVLGATIGAIVFAFALPTTAHAGHAQLHYRFGVPLATTFSLLFLMQKNYSFLVASGAWLAWQFYCGIYMGFYTLLLLAVSAVIYLIYNSMVFREPVRQCFKDFVIRWKSHSGHERRNLIIGALLVVVAMIFLLYPYLMVSHLYEAKRSWSEISSMLPRVQSYFLSDASYLWSFPESAVFANLPMRPEHQMFFGGATIILALLGLYFGSRKKYGHAYILIPVIAGGLVIITLSVNEYSIWYLLHKLPLASAIRVLTRLDQVLLFPLAYLVMMAIDHLSSRSNSIFKLATLIAVIAILVEAAATSMYASSKAEWRERYSRKELTTPQGLAENAIVFYAQNSGPWFADEIDAMLVTQQHGLKTLNGYSGFSPPGYSIEFGSNCEELRRRVSAYISFAGLSHDRMAYRDLMKRVVPVGLVGCNKNWANMQVQTLSASHDKYTEDEIRNLSYQFQETIIKNGSTVVVLRLINSGAQLIEASSAINAPLRLSWRFVDSKGIPASGWDTRMDLPFDIPAGGELIVHIAIDPTTEIKGGGLQFSLVQEGIFWAHDIGVEPLTIVWKE